MLRARARADFGLKMQLRGSLFQKFLARGREPHPFANYNMTIYPKPMNVKVGGYNLSKPILLLMERKISMVIETAKNRKKWSEKSGR